MEDKLNTHTLASSSFPRIATALTYIFFSASLVSTSIFLFLANHPLAQYSDMVVGIVLFGASAILLIFFTYLLPRVSLRGLVFIILLSFFIAFIGVFLLYMVVGLSAVGVSRDGVTKFAELSLLFFILGLPSLFVAINFRAKELLSEEVSA